MEILRFEDLSFTYAGADKKAIENVSFSVNKGEFVLLCGQSGCGKTTLMRLVKKQAAPSGEKQGKIFVFEKDSETLDLRESAEKIGYVLQDPDKQIVCDKVWHELAFGLENLGENSDVIRRRTAEMASYFGIEKWFHKKTSELSGGQKQLLNLASIMVMHPEILILDEPTAQLDPIAASDFLNTLKKINTELGLTVILIEHRLEEVFSAADKVAVMENGKLISFTKPEDTAREMKNSNHPMLLGLPAAVRVFNAFDFDEKCPLDVRHGRDFLVSHFEKCENEEKEYVHNEEIKVELENVYFRYERNLPDVLAGLNLTVYKNEIFCILGGNGCGKTTALNVISGLKKAYRGKVIIDGMNIKKYSGNSLYRNKLAFLPQDVLSVFIKDNVREDFKDILKILGETDIEEKIVSASRRTGCEHLLDRHPYDLSGGEAQKCALAKMLLLSPEILLLDEPTKGLDAYAKNEAGELLRKLKQDGLTVITVTHDTEFAACFADRCTLFFDCFALKADTPEKFFGENMFYTTAANRMSRELFAGAVTVEEVTDLCKKSISK